jgi:hypothetical protein
MKTGKGYEVLRSKFETLVVRKKSIKIHSKPNMECPFVIKPNAKLGFCTCCNPFVVHLSAKKGNCDIVNCADDEKCKYLDIADTKLINDFIRVKKIIKKYYEKETGWLHVPQKIVEKLQLRLKVKSKVYFSFLFTYYGFANIRDDHFDGLLFTKNSQYIKENIL